MLEYKITGPPPSREIITTYQHCKKLHNVDDHQHNYKLVVVCVDGEQDLWLIDDPQGFAEIQRYYKDEGISYLFHMFTYEKTHEVVI